MKNCFLLGTVFVLSACSIDSTSNAERYDGLRDDYFELLEDIDFDDITEPTTLPTTGSAEYEGVLFVEAPGNVDILGDIALNFDFAESEFEGQAEDFVDVQGNGYDGDLAIENGFINRSVNTATNFTYVGDIGGTITGPDDIDYNVDALILGEFFGSDAEHTGGLLSGVVESAGGDFTLNGINSAFFAESD